MPRVWSQHLSCAGGAIGLHRIAGPEQPDRSFEWGLWKFVERFSQKWIYMQHIYIYYIKHVQRWVFLGWEYGWVMLGGSNIVRLWHILQDMQTFANPTGISPWKAYDFVEIFAGHAWVSRCMRNRGKKTASLDINLNQDENLNSPEWKSDPWNMLNESGFAFHG